jgi:hypothetical protein
MEMSGSSQMRISSACPEFKLTSTLLYVQVNYFRVARENEAARNRDRSLRTKRCEG